MTLASSMTTSGPILGPMSSAGIAGVTTSAHTTHTAHTTTSTTQSPLSRPIDQKYSLAANCQDIQLYLQDWLKASAPSPGDPKMWLLYAELPAFCRKIFGSRTHGPYVRKGGRGGRGHREGGDTGREGELPLTHCIHPPTTDTNTRYSYTHHSSLTHSHTHTH